MDVQRPGSSSRVRWRVFLVLFGVALLMIVALWLSLRPPSIPASDIWTAEVRRGDMLVEIPATGTLVSTALRAVTNHDPGVVERIRVLPGDAVTPEDVLLELSNPSLRDSLHRARVDLKAARAEATLSRLELDESRLELEAVLATAEAEYLGERLGLDAMTQLDGAHGVSQVELERKRLRLDALERRVTAERSKLEQFEEFRAAKVAAIDARLDREKSAVENLERRVAALSVTAGVRGVIESVNVEEGERVEGGFAVARIIDPDSLIGRLRVPERYAGQLELGLATSVESSGHSIDGRVVRIDPTPQERQVTVDIEFDSDVPAELGPQVSVQGVIRRDRLEDVTYVSRPSWIESGDESYVFVVQDERAVRKQVEFGRVSTEYVEVLTGLVPGEHLILAELSDRFDSRVLRIEK